MRSETREEKDMAAAEDGGMVGSGQVNGGLGAVVVATRDDGESEVRGEWRRCDVCEKGMRMADIQYVESRRRGR